MQSETFNKEVCIDNKFVANNLSYQQDEETLAGDLQQLIVNFESWSSELDCAGVYITSAVDIQTNYNQLKAASLIAVIFPVFADGRGFSQAKLLRSLGYTGKLRAAGIIADQMRYAKQCGFDQFELNSEHNTSATLNHLNSSYNH